VEYSGLADALMKTHKQGGMRALMGGWIPSMMKNVPAIAIQFAVCEHMLELFRDRGLLTA